MSSAQTRPQILLAHDGELGDIRTLLRELSVPFEECVGRPTSRGDESHWRLVIASPQRLLERRLGSQSKGPTRIAVVENGTRTLVSMLRRSGVDYVVQLPVHPSSLRLLLLHVLYHGPEKRQRERVAVGAPIRFRSKLWKHKALLADLSTRGCRILSAHAARRDSVIQLWLPGELTAGKPMVLRGRVVRTGPATGEEAGTQAMAVVFQGLTRGLVNDLQKAVHHYSQGPATLSTPESSRSRKGADDAPTGGSSAASGEDRRGDERRGYDQSVIALGEEATRVLLGRDISVAAMRVDPNGSLAVGDELRIALHVGTRTEPLIARTLVSKDDGPRGLLLRFMGLSESERGYLKKMVDSLPVLTASPDGDDEDGGVIVSEILEHKPG